MQRGEISGLSDEALGELAAINYVIDARGKTAMEDKSSVKSALGRSPDIAEALMLALGEPAYEPFRFTPLLLPSRTAMFEGRNYPGYPQATCSAQDALDDAAGDPSTFISSPEQMRLLSQHSGQERIRWGSFHRRRAW